MDIGTGWVRQSAAIAPFISWAGDDSPLVSGLSAPRAINDHDPSFSLDAFVPFAEAVFLRVNRARAAGRLDEVRRLLADGLQEEFQAEGPAPQRATLAIAGAQVMAAGQDGTWDTVLVRFTGRRPGRRGRTEVEDWTFQRPVATARAAGETPQTGAPDAAKVLATRATLPPGVEGPGTYDLSTTPLQVSANYAFTPDRTGGQTQSEGQVWQVQPDQTRAVLVIRPDGSGTLTVSGLVPTVPQPAGNSLGQPLGFNESFSCT